MRELFKRSGFAALAMVGVLAPQTASAQAWIGQVAGDMVARQIDMQRRSDCLAQTGYAFATWANQGPRIDALMATFAKASAAGDGKAVKALFSRKADSGLKGADGVVVAPKDIKLPLSGAPERVAVAVAYPDVTARGVWTQPSTDPAAPTLYLTVDFVSSWKTWKIWRIQVSTTEGAATFDHTAYCLGLTPPPPLW